ncbi:hypothetical protein CHS0354_004729 [Potamilus streckersoni]|uniref:Annexin n=1 Tax=Potamilus streckersoni TaxID=2493646 RepID=A0AAE0W781_9BIVA|nr:hypothetical protein CHS0354_004729 [Potamilus streckersoni]
MVRTLRLMWQVTPQVTSSDYWSVFSRPIVMRVRSLTATKPSKMPRHCLRFNVILVSRSYAQLRATFQEYAKLANKDIDDTIKSEMSGDLKDSMLAIVRCIRSKASYFAAQLYKSVKCMVTDNDTVCRVIVSRCEVDMVKIKEEFQQNYKRTLGMFITGYISEDYRMMLLALIREEWANKKSKLNCIENI